MIFLALRNLSRRTLRTALTLFGVSISIMTLASLLAFGQGYQRGLRRELDGMGIQMMLVPLGCPYDAAARVLKGRTLDTSLPATATSVVKSDPAVVLAAPMLMATLPRPAEGRTDLWVGVDESIRPLKPWWKFGAGSHWFRDEASVILGAEAASTEMRQIGDTLYSPETGQRFTVCGILERSGTSDDSEFFIPLVTAQRMFHQPNRLTAIAIRLRDPALLGQAAARLQEVRGAQVVTLTEMMGTFLNLVGAVRTLIVAVAIVALGVSGLSIFNTLLASVLERTAELGILRAVGASRLQVFGLVALEALILTATGSGLGLLASQLGGVWLEQFVRRLMPLAPDNALLAVTWSVLWECTLIGVGVGMLAGLYPAWRASRLSPTEALRTE